MSYKKNARQATSPVQATPTELLAMRKQFKKLLRQTTDKLHRLQIKLNKLINTYTFHNIQMAGIQKLLNASAKNTHVPRNEKVLEMQLIDTFKTICLYTTPAMHFADQIAVAKTGSSLLQQLLERPVNKGFPIPTNDIAAIAKYAFNK